MRPGELAAAASKAQHRLTFVERVGPVFKQPDHHAVPVQKQGRRKIKAVWVDPVPEPVLGDMKRWADRGGVKSIPIPGYWYDKPGYDVSPEETPLAGEKVLYMLHGGAFIGLSAHPSYTCGPMYRKLVSSHPLIRRGFAVEYRLTSGPPLVREYTNPFPAALIDAVAGYAYLVDVVGFAPGDIIVEGDGAGGNLAVALIRYLVETRTDKNHLPAPPGGLILFSPWVDLGDSHDSPGASHHVCTDSDHLPSYFDPIMTWTRKNYCAIVGYPEAPNTNRYISPACIDHEMETVSFKGFPKTLLVYGDAEILHDQVVTLRERMVDDLGGEWVQHHAIKDGVVNMMVMSFFHEESAEAFSAINKWLETTLSDCEHALWYL